MPRIICPKCDASLAEPHAFQDHMEKEHPEHTRMLGFGHTMF